MPRARSAIAAKRVHLRLTEGRFVLSDYGSDCAIEIYKIFGTTLLASGVGAKFLTAQWENGAASSSTRRVYWSASSVRVPCEFTGVVTSPNCPIMSGFFIGAGSEAR